MKTSISIAAAPDHEQRPEVLERRDRDAERTGASPARSTWRVSRRYAARKMTIAILPNSAGWKEIGPISDAEVGAVDLLRRCTGRRGRSSSSRPAAAIV